MSKFLDSITSFFGAGDNLPWTDADIISICEKEAADGGTTNREPLMRLSWALVHSRRRPDIDRGIAMLDAQLDNDIGPEERREVLYLLAVGHYRSEEYAKCRKYLDEALSIAPDFRQALTLKNVMEDKITKDGVIGIGIAVTAVGILGGLAAALSRKR